MKAAAALALGLGLASCTADAPVTGGPFDPIAFFAGRTQSEARLKVFFKPSRQVKVDSVGKRVGDGRFVLDQVIREQGKPARSSRWILRPAGPERWKGSMTDAAGAVTIIQRPTEVAIRYRMAGGQHVDQRLRLAPTGAVTSRMTVSRWGFELARLDETIRKLD